MTAARRQRSFLSCILLLLCTACTLRAQSTPHARNVILVMTDGLRWQELFRGADETLLTRDRFYAGRDVTELKQQFLAPTADERRAKLMPFFWSFFPAQGTVFGDGDQGSVASVTNGFNFSYPGYSETLTGHPDPRIHSNDNIPNPNTTVFEFLNHQPGFSGQVAAFGAWDVFAGIFNAQRCGFPVNAGYAPLLAAHSPRIDLLNAMKLDAPRNWPDEPYDSPVFETALEYIRIQHPRVLFLSLGETDEWAHAGNYGEYLLAAHRADSYLQRLWTALQSMPEYRGNTAIVFANDHGRGNGPDTWKGHGEKIPESKNIFIALAGPGVPNRGVLSNVPAVTQSQVAATLAQLVGEDWRAAEPAAGMPLPLLP